MPNLDFAIQYVLTEGFQRVLVDGCFCHGELLQCVGVDQTENWGFTRRQTKIV